MPPKLVYFSVFIYYISANFVTCIDLFSAKGYNGLHSDFQLNRLYGRNNLMVNKNRISLMAKMAIYDKRYGEGDRAVFSFFRRDYIYRKNMWTRLCVSLGAVFLLGIYWMYQLFVYGVDIHTLNVEQAVTDSVLFLLAVMAFYTMVGTIQGTMQYHIVQKRMEQYLSMMKRLENFPDSETKPEDSPLVYDDRPRRT